VIKFISAVMAVGAIMVFFVGLSDMEEFVRPQGRNVMVHVGPRLFYNIDYYCCDASGVERVDVSDRLFWRATYRFKEIEGQLMIQDPACKVVECRDPSIYWQLPDELRQNIEYARKRALEYQMARGRSLGGLKVRPN